jgi:hypothetical protein
MRALRPGPCSALAVPRILHAVFTLAFLLAGPTSALTVVSLNRNTQELNNTLYRAYDLILRVTETDTGIPFEYRVYDDTNTSVIHTMTVTPGPVQVRCFHSRGRMLP